MAASFQGKQEARLIMFYKIIKGLAQVPFEGVLVEAYKGTRRKHNMKFRQIGHSTSQYGHLFFLKTISAWNRLAFTEAPSLAVFRSNFLLNECASLPHNTLEGSCRILKHSSLSIHTPSVFHMWFLPVLQFVLCG